MLCFVSQVWCDVMLCCVVWCGGALEGYAFFTIKRHFYLSLHSTKRILCRKCYQGVITTISVSRIHFKSKQASACFLLTEISRFLSICKKIPFLSWFVALPDSAKLKITATLQCFFSLCCFCHLYKKYSPSFCSADCAETRINFIF